MAKKNNQSKNILKLLGLLFIILLVIIFILAFLITKNGSNTEEIEEERIITEEEVKEIQDNVRKESLADDGERDRMEYYFSEFIDAIEAGKYDEAYEMLYDDFKKNYFPALSDFEEYAKKTFPEFVSIEHTNFERNGTIYVMWIKMSDALNGTKDSAVELNVVIQEYDLNDFKLSFSVI